MSGTHKYPTISFRISPREREEIEAKIFASGMKKKDYFVRSCIYNRVCVVGKKETVYQIVEKLQEMQSHMEELAGQIKGEKPEVTTEEISELQTSYEDMLKAILWMLDGAKYLWRVTPTEKKKAPTAADVRAVITGKPLLSISQFKYSRGFFQWQRFFRNGGHYGRNKNRIAVD